MCHNRIYPTGKVTVYAGAIIIRLLNLINVKTCNFPATGPVLSFEFKKASRKAFPKSGGRVVPFRNSININNSG